MGTGTTFYWKMCTLTAVGTLLLQNGESFEKATWAKLILCCMAVSVGLSQDT